MVTEQRFRERLSVGPVPSRPTRARITLRYHPPARGPEEGGADRAGIESLTDSFDTLRAIADRGFLGARGVTVTVGAPRPEHLVVELEAEDLPWGLVVIALRIVVSANDADPAAFQELLAALDGDLETATRIYAGVDFDEVAEIDLRLEGAASPAAVDGAQPDGAHLDGTQLSAVPLDPVWLDASAKDVVQVTRLVLPGLAASMPSGKRGPSPASRRSPRVLADRARGGRRTGGRGVPRRRGGSRHRRSLDRGCVAAGDPRSARLRASDRYAKVGVTGCPPG